MELISPLLADNTRRAVRRAIAAGELRGAVIPVGSTEQHNEHLAMYHDTRSVEYVAHSAANRVFPAVVVTPAVSIGVSGHWMDHPGTLTLSPETFTQVVYEVCESLRQHGIRRLMVLNGHGGNVKPMQERIAHFRRALGVRLEFHSYWEAYTREDVERLLATRQCPGHASEYETSVALAVFPDTVHKVPELYPEGDLHITDPARAKQDRDFFTGVRQATAEKGRKMLDIAIDWLAARLRTLVEA